MDSIKHFSPKKQSLTVKQVEMIAEFVIDMCQEQSIKSPSIIIETLSKVVNELEVVHGK